MQKRKRTNRTFTIILASLLTGAYAVGLVSAVGANAEDFYPEESAVPVSWAEEPSAVWSEPPYESSTVWSEPPYESSTVWSEPPQESSYYYETSNIPVAEYSEIEVDNFYCCKYNDYIAVLYYTGDDDNVVIPEILDNLPVKKINESVLETDCLTLTIPKTVEFIGFVAGINYGSSGRIRAYIVDEDNQYYSSDDGVLFDKSKEVCIKCPPGKQGIYVVPEGTVKIQKEAFSHSGLNDIKLPSTLKIIEEYAFEHCTYLKNIVIPDGVETIGEGAFWDCFDFAVFIPKTVKNFFYNSSVTGEEPYPVSGLFNWWNVRIYGFTNTPAEDYADSHDIDFVSVDDAASERKEYTVSLNNKDERKEFVFIAPETGFYVFDFDSENPFYEYGHELSYNRMEIGMDSVPTHYTEVEKFSKGDVYIYSIYEGSSDVKITVGDTYSGTCEYSPNISYTFKDYNLSVSGQGGIYNSDDYYSAFGWKIENDYVKNAVINEGVEYIGCRAFYNMKNLKNVFIPKSVKSIDDTAFSYWIYAGDNDDPYEPVAIDDGIDKIMDYITIYGYSGSYAETFAKEKNIPFVAVDEVKDNDTNIEVAGRLEDGIELEVNELSVEEISIGEENKAVRACFDISLMKDKKEVQPEMPVTVKIPYSGNFTNVEVYRINNDGSKDKMLSNYDGEYITFITDHFSKYAVVTDSGTVGDTNGDGSVDIADALMIARADAGLIQLNEMQLAVSDVNKDNSVDIADALMVARFDAGLISSFQ